MKFFIAILCTSILLVSCHKDRENSSSTDTAQLIKGTWSMDSIVIVYAGHVTIQQYNGITMYMRLTYGDSTVSGVSYFAPEARVTNYQFVAPNKVYSWEIGEQKNENSFATIIAIDKNHLHTQGVDPGMGEGITTYDYYQHRD